MNSCSIRHQIENKISTGLLCVNYLASVGVVVINKLLFTIFDFHPITLTAIHLLVIVLLLQLCRAKNVYVVKRIEFIQHLPLSMLFGAYVLFNNLSIYCNSLVTYQLAKTLANLIIFAIEDFYRDKFWTRSLILGHVLTTSGFIIYARFNVRISTVGYVTCIIGSMLAAGYRIAIASLLVLCPLILFSELTRQSRVIVSWQSILLVLLSGFCAFGINFSSYIFTTRMKPISYILLSTFKFITVIVIGIILSDYLFWSPMLIGIAISIVGVLCYIPNYIYLTSPTLK
ncbi:Solute carrier family 35 member E3 [Trichoplax sp. H2]|nr:Solute carrier family 35 member E3 [Trichoplax sp. H2]|eukprot:RDD47092.1 Solute carrier family 35 member E3 [Trichoplax sp. H2]